MGPKSLNKRCGTPHFVAPEIIFAEMYDESADMWSVGVIIYMLLGGQYPFDGNTEQELYESVKRGQFEFTDKTWRSVSSEARELIRNLLKRDAEERYSAAEALRSSWFQITDTEMENNDLSASQEELKITNLRSTFRGSVLAIMALQKISP